MAASGHGVVSGPPHAFFAYRGFKMFNFDFSLFFWPHREVFRTLVSQTGIEAMLPAVEVQCQPGDHQGSPFNLCFKATVAIYLQACLEG